MDDHEKKIDLPANHKLMQTDTKWKQSRGQDTDTYWYDQVDENGTVVAKYVVKDTTSMYPPFGRSISYEKVE